MSLRYLRAKRFYLTVNVFIMLGIAISAAALVIVMSIMNGFHEKLLGYILNVESHISVTARDRRLNDYDDISENLQHIDSIKYAVPMINEKTLIIGSNVNSGVFVTGLMEKDIHKLRIVEENLVDGSLKNFNQGIVIGAELAAVLNVSAGDKLKVVSPNVATKTIVGPIPNTKEYEIVAIFKMGMHEYDATFVYLPLDQAQSLFGYGDSITQISIIIDDPDDTENMIHRVHEALDDRLCELCTYSWKNKHINYLNALTIERVAMFFILFLIALVASFGIVSNLFMIVKDKRHDIAILRAMGTSRFNITNIFVMYGLIIAAVGTFCGISIGIIFLVNLENIRSLLLRFSDFMIFDKMFYFFDHIPAKMISSDIMIISGLCMVLAFLASLAPAYKASKYDLVSLLRNED